MLECLHSDFPGVLQDVPISQLSEDLVEFDEGEELFYVDGAGLVGIQDIEDDIAGRVLTGHLGLDTLLDRVLVLQEIQVRKLVVLSDGVFRPRVDLPRAADSTALGHLLSAFCDDFQETPVNARL